jgi:sulfur transfer protein SufE
MPAIDEIIENFSVLTMGRPLSLCDRTAGCLRRSPSGRATASSQVQGCASRLARHPHRTDGAAGPTLSFVGDSAAHIVRGLIATCSRSIREAGA